MTDLSQHPTDQLIRELIETKREVAEEEVARIVERIASAPFNREIRTVPRKDRGASYHGTTLGAKADSLAYHLTKRVVLEEQWADGTTADDYIADLRRAANWPGAGVAVYARGPDRIAVALTQTGHVLPSTRCGARPEQLLLVVYSANTGAILTGYQVSSLGTTSIPSEAQWLR